MFTVTMDDRKLLLHLEQLPTAVTRALTTTVSGLANQLLARVRAAEPSRTGYLRSQTRAYVSSGPDFVRAYIRPVATGHASAIAAAIGALEYGAHRRFRVGDYRRSGFNVRSYIRRANITELRFLRGSIDEMRSRIVDELEATVAKAIEPTQ